MIELISTIVTGSVAFFALIQWRRALNRIELMKSWLAEEQNAEKDLLDLEPTLAAELGIKRRVDEKVIEYRSSPPQLTPMQTNLERIWQQQALEQQMHHQQEQYRHNQIGNLLGEIGGGLFSSMWIKEKE